VELLLVDQGQPCRLERIDPDLRDAVGGEQGNEPPAAIAEVGVASALALEPTRAAEVSGGHDAEPIGPGRGELAPAPHPEEEVPCWTVDVGGGAHAVDVTAGRGEALDHARCNVRPELGAREI
jgi:hypothetical protein